MTLETPLTEREIEILRQVATGASNREIAQTLFISANTVKVHLSNIFQKLGVASRTEATLYAIQAGLVESLESEVVRRVRAWLAAAVVVALSLPAKGSIESDRGNIKRLALQTNLELDLLWSPITSQTIGVKRIF